MSKLTIVRTFVGARWANQFRTRAELVDYQNKKLLRHMSYLRQHSPYFGQFKPVSDINYLPSLPQMDKTIMMKHFDQMNTVGVRRDKAIKLALSSEKSRNFAKKYSKGISVGLSSGTSGHRGLFIVSDHERKEWAGVILAKCLPKNGIIRQRVALFLRANNNLYQTINSNLITFKYFDIYHDMQQNIDRLMQYQPTILVAPPSVLTVIAEEIKNKKFSLSLAKLISVAEVLGEADEKYFKKIFGQKLIHQIYQCTEGFLAHTCYKGTLHLNEDIAIFEKEWVDKKRFVPIITDFNRRSQPIVRYRLNDILQIKSSPCGCGSVMTPIRRIEGRESDVLLFKDTNGQEIRVFSDFIARSMIYARGFREYRVVQTNFGQLEVYLDTVSALAKQSIKREVQSLARQFGFEQPTIRFKLYERDLTKKMRRVERNFTL